MSKAREVIAGAKFFVGVSLVVFAPVWLVLLFWLNVYLDTRP